MGEVFDAKNYFEFKKVSDSLQTQKASLESNVHNELLSAQLNVTPEKVEEILNASLSELLSISEEDFRLLLKDYFIFQLEKNHFIINDEIFLSMQYAEEFLMDLIFLKERGRAIVGSPYIVDWIERQDYKAAGDAAIFGYLFYYQKRSNRLWQDDYLQLIKSCFYEWFKSSFQRKNYNSGAVLSTVLPVFLPMVKDCKNDMLKRPLKTV